MSVFSEVYMSMDYKKPQIERWVVFFKIIWPPALFFFYSITPGTSVC